MICGLLCLRCTYVYSFYSILILLLLLLSENSFVKSRCDRMTSISNEELLYPYFIYFLNFSKT